MSGLGQKQTSKSARGMSVVRPRTDIMWRAGHVRFVPGRDITQRKQSTCGLGDTLNLAALGYATSEDRSCLRDEPNFSDGWSRC